MPKKAKAVAPKKKAGKKKVSKDGGTTPQLKNDRLKKASTREARIKKREENLRKNVPEEQNPTKKKGKKPKKGGKKDREDKGNGSSETVGAVEQQVVEENTDTSVQGGKPGEEPPLVVEATPTPGDKNEESPQKCKSLHKSKTLIE